MRRIVSDIREKKPDILDLRGLREKSQEKEVQKKIPLPSLEKSAKHLVAISAKNEIRFGTQLLIFGALGIFLISLINIMGIAGNGITMKESLMETATAGYQKLVAGGQSAFQERPIDALQFFEAAKKDFESAQKELGVLGRNDSSFGPQPAALQSGNAVLTAGTALSEAASAFMKSSQNLQPLVNRFFDVHKNLPTFSLQNPSSNSSITKTLKKELPNIEFAFRNIQTASQKLVTVSVSLLPRNLQDEFAFAQELVASLSNKIGRLQKTLPGILEILGDKEPHRILVLLQNNGELRPTGGFIGSYLLLELNDGYLTKNETHDIYQTDYQLKEIIQPPLEIAALTKQWFMRDSNYSAHFPLSGEKAAWFLQKEGGPSVDTVIAIDQTLLQDLLEVTGPIYLPELNNFFTKENFRIMLSYIVESKLEELGGKEDPKYIMKTFVPLFEKALFAKADVKRLAAVLEKAVREKHLMGYSRLTSVQELFAGLGADGVLKTPGQNDDYLQVVHISVGGNKSDAYIKEIYTHDTFFMSDGTLEDELTIEKLHSWNAAEERHWLQTVRSFGFSDISEAVREVLGRGKNVTFTRVYVPTGSVLLGTDGGIVETKFDEETGKTYFFAKMETEHGKTTKLKIRYRLPFRQNFDPSGVYRLIAQKQMGTDGAKFIKRISPAPRIQNLRTFPATGQLEEDGSLTYSTILDTDKTFASLWRVR